MGWEQPKKDFKKKNAENAMFENMYHSFKTHPNVVSKIFLSFFNFRQFKNTRIGYRCM